jgi:chemotaxis protein methyltransferase CheR
VTVETGSATGAAALTSREFTWIRNWLHDETGIDLKPGRETLVAGRLERRLRHHGLATYSEYIRLLLEPGHDTEVSLAVDLLTTNETSFFREQRHFDRLPAMLPPVGTGRPIRIWSAASSTGEEAYSIALTLMAELRGRTWEVLGTDVSGRVLEVARRGLYPIEAADRIPPPLLRAHCLRGRGEYEGFLAMGGEVRSHATFRYANLTRLDDDLGEFDVVFLRNVMIYFNPETKTGLLERVARMLHPGGYLLIGHAESLNGLRVPFDAVAPSIYRRAASA